MVGESWVELVGMPGHCHFVAVFKGSKGTVETTLANPAPRTGDVGPNINNHDQCNTR